MARPKKLTAEQDNELASIKLVLDNAPEDLRAIVAESMVASLLVRKAKLDVALEFISKYAGAGAGAGAGAYAGTSAVANAAVLRKRGRPSKASLGLANAASAPVTSIATGKRKLSKEALEGIRRGQAKRWAKVHKEQREAEKAAKLKALAKAQAKEAKVKAPKANVAQAS